MVQRPVAPGQTFTYGFRLPDAGTFWCHPHNNETVQRASHGFRMTGPGAGCITATSSNTTLRA